RTDTAVNLWPDEPATEGVPHGRLAELRQSGGDRTGFAPSSGDRRLRGPLADAGISGGDPSELHLGAIGTTARRSGSDAGTGPNGQAFGFGYTEIGRL